MLDTENWPSRRPIIDLATEARKARIERWKAERRDEAKWANASRPSRGMSDAITAVLIVIGGASAVALGMVGAWEIDRRLHPEQYPTTIEQLEESLPAAAGERRRRLMDIPGYDAWKLATPPEYEWPEPGFYCDGCGAFDMSECLCDAEPHPDDLADLIDEAQAARTQ